MPPPPLLPARNSAKKYWQPRHASPVDNLACVKFRQQDQIFPQVEAHPCQLNWMNTYLYSQESIQQCVFVQVTSISNSCSSEDQVEVYLVVEHLDCKPSFIEIIGDDCLLSDIMVCLWSYHDLSNNAHVASADHQMMSITRQFRHIATLSLW